MNNKKYYSRLCGKLLGDGSIVKQYNRRSPRFKFQHRIQDLGWTQYCYEQLCNFLPLSPPAYKKNIDKRTKCGYTEAYYVQSKTSPLITSFHKMWYPSGTKIIPFPLLYLYLNEEALAWWYQDDGHLKVVNGIMQKVILSTDSFTTFENEMLISLIYDRFYLMFSLDGQNRLILYDQFQIIYFLNLISPWLHSSMKRKHPVILPLKHLAKRTTIYLPTEIKLFQPTKEINEKLNKLKLLLPNEFKTVHTTKVFNIFQPLLQKQTNKKPYQIQISDENRHVLAILRQQTGLTISQLAMYCFVK